MIDRAQRDALAARLDGITPVLVTPFSGDGAIDSDALRAELQWLADFQVGAVAIGLASEVTRLTEAERVRLTEDVRRHLPEATALIAACSADSERAAVDLGTRLAGAGADILMVTPPRVPGIAPDAVAGFYAAMAEGTGLGLIVQDAPQETGVGIGDEALRELVGGNRAIVGAKLESADALDRMSRLAPLLAEAGVPMLGGSGGADYLIELELGAAGTLPGPALTDVFLAVHRSYRAGDTDAAAALMREFGPHIEIARRGMQPFIRAQKEFLAARGLRFPVGGRRPAAPLPDWAETTIERLAAALGDKADALAALTKKGH